MRNDAEGFGKRTKKCTEGTETMGEYTNAGGRPGLAQEPGPPDFAEPPPPPGTVKVRAALSSVDVGVTVAKTASHDLFEVCGLSG
eukprot:gene23444-biopygen7290